MDFGILIHEYFYLGNGVIPGVLDISIPTYVLRGTGSSTHFQYEICIVTPTDRWSILRRYTRFRELYHYMRKKYGSKVTKIPFPPRKLFGRTSESVARERRKQLEVTIAGHKFLVVIKEKILIRNLFCRHSSKRSFGCVQLCQAVHFITAPHARTLTSVRTLWHSQAFSKKASLKVRSTGRLN